MKHDPPCQPWPCPHIHDCGPEHCIYVLRSGLYEEEGASE